MRAGLWAKAGREVSLIDDFLGPLVPWPPRDHAARSPRSFPKGGSAMALEPLSRRMLLPNMGRVAGAAALGSRLAMAQTPPGPVSPPSTITSPPRDFGPNAPPTTYFTDPDVLVVDPAFGGLIQVNSSIKRLWTGSLWAEGPAWNAQGRYLVWSDIPNNVQLR